MDGRTLGLVELSMVFGLVLGLGVWQLWSLRRERRRDAAREAQHAAQRDVQRQGQQGAQAHDAPDAQPSQH